MFLAYVRKHYPHSDRADEYLTYTCKDHSEHELITLLFRFRFLWNELNPNDKFEFQLLYLTDLSVSVRLQDVLELGAIEITKTELESMRSKMIDQKSQLKFQQKMQETWNASVKEPEIPSQTVISSEDLKAIENTLDSKPLTSEAVAEILENKNYSVDEGVTGE